MIIIEVFLCSLLFVRFLLCEDLKKNTSAMDLNGFIVNPGPSALKAKDVLSYSV